jgi:FtsP/CotA-like multicopper oxidase with cupredoxin domain
MKFVIEKTKGSDSTEIPHKLVLYPRAKINDSVLTRYIALYMYMDLSMKEKMGMGNGNGNGNGMGNGNGTGMGMMGMETGMLINAVPFDAPVTEIAKQGTSEIWHVINLSTESHPLHIHLALFTILNHTHLVNVDKFTDCMTKMNDSLKCDIDKYAKGKVIKPPPNEMGWKNVVKIDPGFMTTILVRFSLLDSHHSYPFNVSAVPGYVYHCHMLDHEDNEMMRPLQIVS